MSWSEAMYLARELSRNGLSRYRVFGYQTGADNRWRYRVVPGSSPWRYR